MADQVAHKLVILRQSPLQVLLVRSGQKLSLPQIQIPPRERIADVLTRKIKELWDLDAVCLFSFAGTGGPSEPIQPCCQCLEIRNRAWTAPREFLWARQFDADDFTCIHDHTDLHLGLSTLAKHEHDAQSGPFARVGWMDDLISWMKPHLARRGLTLTGEYRQLNGDPHFILICFKTNSTPVWFKAVGEPNLREYSITLGLVEKFPDFFAYVLATHPDWHGWLMLDANGCHSVGTFNSGHWQRAASALAELQVASSYKTRELEAIGCRDRGLETIQTQIDPFLVDMERVMPLQQSKALQSTQLENLGHMLKSSCAELGALGLPDCFGHGDFGPHNILFSRTRCVFIDLAEAQVTHPLFTFQYLLDFLRPSNKERSLKELMDSYVAVWSKLVDPELLMTGLRLSPILTILWHATGSWFTQREQLLKDNLQCARYGRMTYRLWKMAADLGHSPHKCSFTESRGVT